MKKILLKLYYFGNNKKEKINSLQKTIRNIEWESIVDFIPENSSFLDVGSGSGYSMELAEKQKHCKVTGIDPNPNTYGVGRNWENSSIFNPKYKIDKGDGVNLPYDDNSFDVVFSSHVLEHVENKEHFLKEIRRVAKKSGILIIGVPTSSMALINMISQILFLSHHRIFNFILSRIGLSSFPKISIKHLFFLYSHSFPNRTVLYDLKNYRIKNWTKIISKEIKIINKKLPAIYPYPDYLQLFKLKKNKKISSSVFFICEKSNN